MLSFWHGKWLKDGTLRSLIQGPLSREEDNIVVSLVSMVNGILVEFPWSFPLTYASQLKPLPAGNFPKPVTSLDGFLLLTVLFILKMPTRWPQLIPIQSPISLVIGYGTFPPFQKFQLFVWKCLQNSFTCQTNTDAQRHFEI